MSKDDIIRFRCEGDMRARFARVASLLRRDEPDLARIIFEDFIAKEEHRLGLTHYQLKDAPTAHLSAILSGARAEALRETAAPVATPVQAAPATYQAAAPKARRTPRRQAK